MMSENFDDVDGADDVIRFHVMPMFGHEHESSTGCWCSPTLECEDLDTGAQVWLHAVYH